MVGTALSYCVSAQFAGQDAGPLMGGFVGGHIGMGAQCSSEPPCCLRWALLLIGTWSVALVGRDWTPSSKRECTHVAASEAKAVSTAIAALPRHAPVF